MYYELLFDGVFIFMNGGGSQDAEITDLLTFKKCELTLHSWNDYLKYEKVKLKYESMLV